MPKGQNYSPYQKGVIKRYYEHKETIANHKLGEIVSELALCTDSRKTTRLWERAQKALLAAGANEVQVRKLVADRSLQRLAKLVGELF